MKDVLFGLLVLVSVSAQASDCTYVLNHTGGKTKTEPQIEKIMKRKGYVRAFTEGRFSLTTISNWWTGHNGMDHEGGDSYGSAILKETQTGKVLASYTSEGRASFLNIGIGKDAYSTGMTKAAVRSLPNCDQL